MNCWTIESEINFKGCIYYYKNVFTLILELVLKTITIFIVTRKYSELLSLSSSFIFQCIFKIKVLPLSTFRSFSSSYISSSYSFSTEMKLVHNSTNRNPQRAVKITHISCNRKLYHNLWGICNKLFSQ